VHLPLLQCKILEQFYEDYEVLIQGFEESRGVHYGIQQKVR